MKEKPEYLLNYNLKQFTILKVIANITRFKHDNVGPISVNEINKSFETVVGTSPVDDSAVMLQRLPGLGRVSSENMDRQFIDYYILDGLRADNLIDIVYRSCNSTIDEIWVNPLGKTGIEIVAKRIQIDRSANLFMEYLKKVNNGNNKVLSGDILASLVYYAKKNNLDLHGLLIQNAKISALNLSKSLIENFMIKDSEISELDISHCSFSKLSIKDCIINTIYGISKESEIPSYIINSIIEKYQSESMEYGNKVFGVKDSHMILISLIKKLFFLGGNNKSEDELLKSFGVKDSKRIASLILKEMVKEKIISKPDSKNQFSPKTFNRNRMKNILKDLNNSSDSLWLEVGKIK